MKKLVLPVLVIALSIGSLVVNAAGPSYGASAPFFGGTNTYGYSWAGWDGKTCTTTTLIGKGSWTVTKKTWAQTSGCYYPGQWNVYENHSFK